MGNCECIGDSKEIKEITTFKQNSKKKNKFQPSKNVLKSFKKPKKLDDSLKCLLYEKCGYCKEEPLFEVISKEEFDFILNKNKRFKQILHILKEEINSIKYEQNIEYENVVPIKMYGTKTDKDPQYYQGNYNNEGQCHGFGVWTKNGYIYIGNFKNDLFSGMGLLINKEGSCYLGEWKKGKCNGKGQIISADDRTEFEGTFINNRKEQGIEKLEDGSIYVGIFSNDNEKNGKGKYIFHDRAIFEGNFKNSCPEFGVIEWSDGKKYNGTFKDGQIDGRGKYSYKNGVVFSGGFVENKKDGDGEYKWPDGKIFQCKWKNNIPEGEGIFIDNINKINEVIHYQNGKITEEINGEKKNDKK